MKPHFLFRDGRLILARFPYPQTPDSAKAYLWAHGINLSQLARDNNICRSILVDLLRGHLKGDRGDAHRGAVLLGLKADPVTFERLAA